MSMVDYTLNARGRLPAASEWAGMLVADAVYFGDRASDWKQQCMSQVSV